MARLAGGSGISGGSGKYLETRRASTADLGEHARAIEAAERACAIAEAVGELGLRLGANHYFGHGALACRKPTPGGRAPARRDRPCQGRAGR